MFENSAGIMCDRFFPRTVSAVSRQQAIQRDQGLAGCDTKCIFRDLSLKFDALCTACLKNDTTLRSAFAVLMHCFEFETVFTLQNVSDSLFFDRFRMEN